jgi:2-polyprenyl-3-methyl-5-hydroxy-6-metoxy-1,4-benzoquinol methylase
VKVDAVDFSLKAKEKALNHAKNKNVNINYTVENLEHYNPQKTFYDAAGLIFVHLNEKIRGKIHKKVMESLKPGGVVIMEAYSKEQMGRTSGGPQSPEMLYSIENIKETFAELIPLMLSKEIIHLSESSLHSGEASVIRFIGKKKTK